MTAAPSRKPHLYGGQAVIDGVMMRGRDHWALAVRRPDRSLHLESHEIPAPPTSALSAVPGLRGLPALGRAISIGARALAVSAGLAAGDQERITPRQVAATLTVALLLFVGLFVVVPAVLAHLAIRPLGSILVANLLEGALRIALLVGYLGLMGRRPDVRRVFQYHGAEHQTIAAHEQGDPLEPESVLRHPTPHIRCGTNFLLIVMLLTVPVFPLFGAPGLWWRVLLRVAALPLLAGLAFEVLRLGARFERLWLVRATMQPGLWLQRITTRQPERDQVEVAVAAFREVLRREREAAAATPPS
jgi:uncharacterized protein YqhQ